MGLGRVVGEPVKVILPMDSSIKPGSDYEKYKSSGFDEGHLVLDPGDLPCRFLIRQLSDDAQDIVATQPFSRAQSQWRVRLGLSAVENYSIRRPDGSMAGAPVREVETTPNGVEALTPDYMRNIGLLPEQLAALATLIKEYSELTVPLQLPSAPPSGGTESESPESKSTPSAGPKSAGNAL